MNGQAGKGVIALLLCLIFLSALIFVFIESTKVSKAQSLTDAKPEALVELVDPNAFTGVMNDYEYDLYRKDGDRFTFVPPPDLDYADPASLDEATLSELDVATDEILPASREITITLLPCCQHFVDPSDPELACDCNDAPAQTGNGIIIRFTITPATKTIILEGGRGTQEVFILPSRVDLYLAVRTPNLNLLFLNRFSTTSGRYFFKPVVFSANMPINSLKGTFAGTLVRSNFAPGVYTVYAVMVTPGQKLFGNPNRWLSNLATSEFPLGFVQ